MNEIIKVKSNTNVGGSAINTVDARELHKYLGVGKDFATWIKETIRSRNLKQDVDYKVASSEKVDYTIAKTVAVDMSILDKGKVGSAVRKYLIAQEGKATSSQKSFLGLKTSPTMFTKQTETITELKAEGYLYIVVFEDGVVKLGQSKNKPSSRIASHTFTGKKLGVGVHSIFTTALYSSTRWKYEKELIKTVATIAAKVKGREWFKFPNAEQASSFAKTLIECVEKSTLEEKSSEKEVTRKLAEKEAVQNLMKLLGFTEPTPKNV